MGLIVTTSRRPSPRTRSLVKDLVGVIPGAVRLTRGHMSMEELAREALIRGLNRVVVIGERRGNPSIIRVYAVKSEGLGLDNIVSFIVKGVTLSREAGSGYPGVKSVLVVESDGSSISDEFAEAFIIGFKARLSGPRDSVIARIKAVGAKEVTVRFLWRGTRVGPRLKLSKPRAMMKVREAEG